MRAATAELLAPWQWWRLAYEASRRTEYIWAERGNVALYWGTVKCRYNAVLGVQEIDRVIAVTAL